MAKFEITASQETFGETGDQFFISVRGPNEIHVIIDEERVYQIEDLVALKMLLEQTIDKACTLYDE